MSTTVPMMPMPCHCGTWCCPRSTDAKEDARSIKVLRILKIAKLARILLCALLTSVIKFNEF